MPTYPSASLLLPVGVSRRDDDLSLDAAAIAQLLAVNLNAPLAIVHGVLPALLGSKGTVVLFGSVAAQRGRGKNVAYAAAKRGLTSLAESLRQRYRPRELHVQLWQLGFLIGIGGPATYQRANRLRGLVTTMPLDFLLLETDAPDQPDADIRGQRNEPARLAYICETIAQLRCVHTEVVAQATSRNARQLFNLPEVLEPK